MIDKKGRHSKGETIMKNGFHKLLKSILVIMVMISLNDIIIFGVIEKNYELENENITELVKAEKNVNEVELDNEEDQEEFEIIEQNDDETGTLAVIDDSKDIQSSSINSNTNLEQRTNVIELAEFDDTDQNSTVTNTACVTNKNNLNSSEINSIRQNLITSVNESREDSSVNVSVSESSSLDKTSQIRSQEIIVDWSHERPNGSNWETVLFENGVSSSGLKAGEDLAKISVSAKSSYSQSFLHSLSNAIHTALMNSPTHKKVILNQNYQQIGVGITSKVVNGKLNIYVTEHFKNNSTSVTKTKGTSLFSIKSMKNGFTVKWVKQANQTNGYQIQYSKSSKFSSGNKSVNITKNTTISKTIKNLSAGKKYYVRIRTYRKANGKTYYSGWSSVKSVTTKK
jgi:uncharacterized protein YkwD